MRKIMSSRIGQMNLVLYKYWGLISGKDFWRRGIVRSPSTILLKWLKSTTNFIKLVHLLMIKVILKNGNPGRDEKKNVTKDSKVDLKPKT
jgi:hypothetical protein